jgi:hypothetical protein
VPHRMRNKQIVNIIKHNTDRLIIKLWTIGLCYELLVYVINYWLIYMSFSRDSMTQRLPVIHCYGHRRALKNCSIALKKNLIVGIVFNVNRLTIICFDDRIRADFCYRSNGLNTTWFDK